MSVAPKLLSVENMSKSYGGVHAVRGVSFQLAAGEILAALSNNRVGGAEYDRAWPERARKTLW